MKGNRQLIEKMVNRPYYNGTPEWKKIENEMDAWATITFCPFRCRFTRQLEFQRKDRKRPSKFFAEVNIYEDNVTIKLSYNKPKTLTPEMVNEINKWQLKVLDVCIKNNLITIQEDD